MNNEETQRRFNDRAHAGFALALELRRFLGDEVPVVLALARGGVPVAQAVAGALSAPLDLVVPGRIPVPGREGDTLGAITSDRTLIINTPLLSEMGLSDQELEELSIPVWAEVQRLEQVFSQVRHGMGLQGRTAVVVDDGLTTGYTMTAAVLSVRKLEPARLMVAVPVASIEAIERIRGYVDDLLSLEISSSNPFSVARYYKHYPPVTDSEIVMALEHPWSERPGEGYGETF